MGQRLTWSSALVVLGALLGAAGLQAQPAPYNDAVAARFPAPAVRYSLPVFSEGRDDFSTQEAEITKDTGCSIVEAGQSPRDAARSGRNHHRRHHEGN